MNTNLISNLHSYTAYGGLPSRALDFGKPYGLSNKASQNRIISENILRKAAQLVEDLATINARTKALQNPSLLFGETKPTAVRHAEQQLTNSIKAIRDLQEKLGIETSVKTVSKNETLQALLKQDRGALFDTKT